MAVVSIVIVVRDLLGPHRSQLVSFSSDDRWYCTVCYEQVAGHRCTNDVIEQVPWWS